MEAIEEKSISESRGERIEEDEDGGRTALPGFRFHPTDEELVAFYLRRKVEKKPLSIELIKHVDIYKYDPWDLPSKFPSVIHSFSSSYSPCISY